MASNVRQSCIAERNNLNTVNWEPLEVYTECLVQARIPSEDKLIYEGDFRYQGGFNETASLLKRGGKRPTTIFCLLLSRVK
jgi:DNA-binding LacI/PurR family transcriptional regulator